METLLDNKKLIIINIVITGYFIVIYGFHHLELQTAITVFVTELLTIPFVLAAIVFSVLGIKKLLSGTMNYTTGVSFLFLLTCTALIIISFVR